MEDALPNWNSHLEIEEEDIFNQSLINSFDEKEFLRELILEQPDLSPNPSSKGDATSPTNSCLSFVDTNFDDESTLHKCNSSNSIMSLEKLCASSNSNSNSNSSNPHLWSFDNYSIIHEPSSKHDHSTLLASKKTSKGEDGFEMFEPRVHQARKKVRSSLETRDHIMAERKRRQELTESIIALSAMIPGLKKTDKAYVLREAVTYMKKLQERVKELENRHKDRRVDYAIFTRKGQSSTNTSTASCKMNSDSGYRSFESLLEVEARVQEKEVFIGIHCPKQNNIVLKIHALLEKLHLSIASSSALQFGTSTLIITLIAQMDDEYNMAMDDLVKKLWDVLIEACDMPQ